MKISKRLFNLETETSFTVLSEANKLLKEGKDIINLGTDLVKNLWKNILDVDLPDKFIELTYQEAMETYGSDKPDLRFDLPLLEFEDFVKMKMASLSLVVV